MRRSFTALTFMAGLITLSTALVAGCVNVYVQPAPTARLAPWGSAVLLQTPFPLRQPTLRPSPGPVFTTVSSFNLTSANYEVQGASSFVLGWDAYLVTFKVTGTHAQSGWCAMSFVGSSGPDLVVDYEAGTKVYSASAVMRYVHANDDRGGMMLLNRGQVAIMVAGDCPNWEIHGQRQEWLPGVTAPPHQ